LHYFFIINLNKFYLYDRKSQQALEQLLKQQITLDFDRKRSKFTLVFGDHTIQQNVCEFLLTSSFLVGQNVEEFIMSTDSCFDRVRIPMTTAGKSITLELTDFIRLRDIYGAQMYQLKLEDLLLHRGISLSR
jgi:hypothetical protein